MNKENLDRLLDKCINNELKSNEKQKLEILLSNSSDLRIELKMKQDIAKGIQYIGNEDLRKLLEEIHSKEIDNHELKLKKKSKWLIGLAVLATLGLALYFVLGNNSEDLQIDNQALYASLFKAYEPSISSRGRDKQKSLKEFYNFYLEKDYESAIEIIRSDLSNQKMETHLMIAISAMYEGEESLAHESLSRIIYNNDFYFVDHAKWYQALLYFKQSQKDLAIPLLRSLADDINSDHHQEAKNLLNKLNLYRE